MQYFAQDEATRLDPTLTVYQTLAGDAPIHMVPHIRNILGGFLFSGDDVEKPVRVLSGGERTRLAVARMLLRPSNTLLLDEPTNHLDLGLEGRPARGARGFRRHADLRLARPLLRRQARDEGGRHRPWRGRALSGELRGVPVEPEAARRDGRRGTAARWRQPRAVEGSVPSSGGAASATIASGQTAAEGGRPRLIVRRTEAPGSGRPARSEGEPTRSSAESRSWRPGSPIASAPSKR